MYKGKVKAPALRTIQRLTDVFSYTYSKHNIRPLKGRIRIVNPASFVEEVKSRDIIAKDFQNMVNVFKRREKLLSQYENLDPQQIIENTIAMIDPMFEHPYCWHGIGEENLTRAKKLWNVI